MPWAAPKVCAAAGCSKTTSARYCDAHAHLQSNWAPDRRRGNRHQRGYGKDWSRLRKVILHRDKYLCVPCKARGLNTSATEVDHIIPKAAGGDDAPSNLQSICTDCHRSKTGRDGQRGRGGEGRKSGG